MTPEEHKQLMRRAVALALVKPTPDSRYGKQLQEIEAALLKYQPERYHNRTEGNSDD